jgi:hypothetical protein
VGTAVILDTYEICVVHGANPDPAQLHRPIIRVVVTGDGQSLGDGFLTDLTDTNEDGTFKRSIIKVTDPDKYGIKPSDYFV